MTNSHRAHQHCPRAHRHCVGYVRVTGETNDGGTLFTAPERIRWVEHFKCFDAALTRIRDLHDLGFTATFQPITRRTR